jgi:hypothetical protein
MRNTYKFLFVITLGLQSCSPKLQPYSAEVNFIYKEATGTIAVKSTGYGNNQTDAVSDAQKNAFKVILFKGLPGTELNIPLIENENEAKLKHSFMMSSTESSNLIKMKGLNKITVDVKINYNSLRKDLEQHKLIRKFGL